ncbi:MAG: hypothetical protein HBSAPP03_18400 [Phycisphaerae bacterium]|nr:MAG: hypothetical protein HBSAPP03_18400 [Phycisphaerae bacterium]
MTISSRAGISVLGAGIVAGFAAAVGLWVVWFVTHLPWINLPERHSIIGLLVCWLGAFVACGYNLGRARGWVVGLTGGVISAVLGLLVLGSKLRPPASIEGELQAVHPSAGVVALGFVAMGAVVGLVGGTAGGMMAPASRASDPEPDWLGRFAWVTCAAAMPLLFIGGLVTSTDSGMAVPDWPNTFGSNMFLYPLGPRSASDVYLEHSHRLFGTLLGLSAVVLTIWTVRRNATQLVRTLMLVLPVLVGSVSLGLILFAKVHAGFVFAVVGILGMAAAVAWREPRGARWPKVLALLVLAFIVIQGWLGGTRVLEDSRARAIIHGVSAQAILAGLVGLAVYLSPSFARLATIDPPAKESRRLKFLATALMHSLLLQLILGAVYRHLRHGHVLWTHAAFAMVVLVAALAAGTVAQAYRRDQGGPARAIRLAGTWVLAVVGVQFVLGWVAFMGAGQGLNTASVTQALIRTAHQANGALLLAAATVLFVMARQANRLAAR